MSCQDMVPWPLVAPGDFDYYEERAGQGEIMVQTFDQNQQVGHGLQDRQGSHEFAQAYAAAVSLAARFQPSQLNIVDEIAVDAEMPDLPEVLDLHQPLPHRNAIPCSQDVDPGSLVLVPSQDPFAGLPVLHLDKNTILDFLQAPQSERQPGQRYLEGTPQNTPHSASQASLPFCLESYSYPSLPLVQTTSSQQAGNQNYPINHKQMLAQKYAAEELQNSAFSHMVHVGMDGNDPTAALHQLYMGPDPLQQQQQQLNKDENAADLLEGTIVGVDLSLSKSHANTSLCPQNRIPSQIVNRQDFPTVSRPPKKDRFQRSPPKETCGVFCDECGLYYDKECVMHRVMVIEDQMVQPRAFASLPTNHLSIQNLSSNASQPVFGVFSKKLIPNRTVFGPMEGIPVQVTHKPNLPFPIYISEDKDGCVLLDTKDDDRSNWMRFVRYATSPVEQNLALFQQGSQIFFKSIVQIESKTELKVWYSDGYAQRYRLWLPQEFYGLECDLPFPNTDILLQHIMSEHNDNSAPQEPVRKPKMHRYPSGNQWTETSMSRQHSPQHAMNIAPTSSAGELPNVYCEPIVVENQVQRKGKRAINPPQTCNQELLPYSADKSLDPVEIIEHITQAIGVDCSGTLSSDMLPNGYLALQNQHMPHLKESDSFFNVRADYPTEETRDLEKRPEVPIMPDGPTAEQYHDTSYYTCKKKKTDSNIRERQKVDSGNVAAQTQAPPEAAMEEPRTVPSKISKFYQRHNEESSRSPETSSQSDSSSSSSYRSDESSNSDSSRCSILSEEPPPPKRLIKNIKNKHYVRADSNIVEIDSPLPSEESADICDELVATEPEAEKPPSPKATFMTPLKKKLPKLIPEEYQVPNASEQNPAAQLEVQNAEITSAGCSESIEPPVEKKPETSNKDEKRTFPCLLCDAEFLCRIMLKRHSEQHNTPEGFKCTLCPRVLKDYMMIRRHIKLYHIYPTTKSFRCDVCGKTFCHTDKFQRHMRVHQGDKKFKCEQCGKILSRKDKLVNHIRNVHFTEKPDEQQETQISLDSSPKASPDSTQPMFPANRRDSNNGNKNNLNKCRLKKEGAGIVKECFQCDKCQKTFRKRGMLAQHYAKEHPEVSLENTSLNDVFEKVISEFPCPYCDKSYKSSTKRKQHILQKHPDQEIPQSYKTMAASVKSSYVKCPWCPSQYTVRCKLYSHQRSKHHEVLEILNLTGITEEAWEKKVPLSKKAECMEIQAKLEAELLARKDLQDAAKSSQQLSHEKKSAKNPDTSHH